MSHIEPLESRIQFDGGALDTSFGDDGAITIDYKRLLGDDGWRSAGMQFTQDTGGRVYVTSKQRRFAEGSLTLLDEKLVITRFSRDGQLDTAFGGGGFKLLDRNPATAGAFVNYEVKTFVDANNRTHVLDGALLWRLTPGGRADMTFGRRGKITVPLLIGGPIAGPQHVAFDADGRAYIAGSSQGKTGTRMAVVRLTESGAWESAWGYQSPVPAAGATGVATLIRFLPDGRLMIAGVSDAGSAAAAWVTRLEADGTVDTTYGVDGYARHEYDTQSSVENAAVRPVQIAPDGAVVGYTEVSGDNPDSDAAYSGYNWRFDANGARVQPFQIVPPEFDQLYDREFARQMAVQSDGKILARGGPDQDDLLRGNGDGTLDTTWGDNGIVPGEHPGIGDSLQIAVDGSILTPGGNFDANIVKVYRLFRDDAPLGQFDGRQLIAPRTTATRFSVTFRDDDGIDAGSIDSADVRIFGPFDAQPRSRGATLETVEALGGGRFRATYKVTSLGGWTAADNGVYSVRLVSGQVADTTGVAAGASALGTFRVRIR